MHRFKSIMFGFATVAGLIAAISDCKADSAAKQQSKVFRRFRMGFTGFPSDITLEAVLEARKFSRQNADILAHHIEGVPWDESLYDKPFSKEMMNDWKGKLEATPKDGKVYLAISPGRGELKVADKALPLPEELKGKSYDDSLVKKAFLNYTRRAMEFFEPDYLAIGIEVNEIYQKSPPAWKDYANLHRYIYDAIKKERPHLPVFASFTLHSLLTATKDDQAKTIAAFDEIMGQCDLVAVSFYPFIASGTTEIEAAFQWLFDHYDKYKKPYVIAETGEAADRLVFPSTGQIIDGTPQKQADYYRTLLAVAQKRDFEFVISFLHRDYDAMWAKIKSFSPEAFMAWRDCGLLDEDAVPRPAYNIWKRYSDMPLEPAATRVAGETDARQKQSDKSNKVDDLSSFVVVSRRDPRYFELSNGSPYIPIGFNLVGPPREDEFDRLFKIMADNRINYCRVWVSHRDWNVEHEKPLQFDPDRAKTIDRFLSLARKNGVRVKMCLEYFRDIRADRNRWSDNLIYHKSNGGPYESMHDYLSSDTGRSHFKAKLDWYADRYGDDPAVFAWELWNEMDAVRGSEWLDWTKEMLPELHRQFPRNLAVQSLGSYDWEKKRPRYKTLCLLKDNDVAQVHRYLDEGAGWEICHGPVDVLASQAVRELIAFNPGKPIILTETGAVKPRHTGCSELYAKDRDGILLHDMLFAPFFSGAAGTGHIWWWRQALDEPNLWYHFARFAEAVKRIDPPEEHFEPVMISEDRCRLYVLKGRKTVLAWCRGSRNDWKNELILGRQPEMLEGLEIDLRPFLTGSHQTQARVFDPWENRWRDVSIESGRLRLDGFKRSAVIRVE